MYKRQQAGMKATKIHPEVEDHTLAWFINKTELTYTYSVIVPLQYSIRMP